MDPINSQTKILASASEQRVEYGVLLGIRLMEKNDGNGFSIDFFGSYNVGYRNFQVEEAYKSVYSSVDQSTFSQTITLGLNFGYSLSFDGSRNFNTQRKR
jgi:hypothetical protein